MPDWSASMQQTFEFYVIDPNTWMDQKQLTTVKSCSITRDIEADTLGSATFDVVDSVGECYIRVYLKTIQNGVTERHPLGTFLVQSPSSSFDGKMRTVSMDAYTPLLELKEKQPPLGYFVSESKSSTDAAYYKIEERFKYVETGDEFTLRDDAGETVLMSEVKTHLNERDVYKYTPSESEEVFYYCIVMGTKYAVKKEGPIYIRTSETLNIDNDTHNNKEVTQYIAKYITATGDDIYKNGDTLYCRVNNFMDMAYRLTRENVRAPVVKTDLTEEDNVGKLNCDFVADPEDTWFTFLRDLIANGNFEFALDELGRVMFSPKQDTISLQPVWTYDDSNSSILLPEIDMDHDLYGVPNVVEVVYNDGKNHYYAKVTNTDENSPTSIPNRGREITYRVTDPDFLGVPTQKQIDEYAKQLLREASTVEYTVTYTHGYCPVRVNDCVRLNYERAGLKNIKARVVSQKIKCEPGCPVTEKAIFTNKLWG